MIAMNFQLSEEHLMIQQAARDFAQNECLPGVIERDEKTVSPRTNHEIGRTGIYGHDGRSGIWRRRPGYR